MRQAEATITFTFEARAGYTKSMFEDFLKGASKKDIPEDMKIDSTGPQVSLRSEA
jgi:hypothetical protein